MHTTSATIAVSVSIGHDGHDDDDRMDYITIVSMFAVRMFT